ncbi:hypothetical protein I020019A2_11310 [Bifidobacterium pseudocatenulatum]
MNAYYNERTIMENPSAFPMGEPNDGFAQYFVGQSYLASVLDAPEFSIHNVTFEPGCRNNWHIHHGGAQVLIAVGGRGYYQIEGQEPKELKAGEAVCIPADTKHWHGAAPGEPFSHLAFMVPAGDPGAMSNEWLEPVDAQAYESLA